MKLICVFVFAYAKSRFSHDEAQKYQITLVDLILIFVSVAYNNRMRQFVILDSKGMTTWKRDQVDPRGKSTGFELRCKNTCFQDFPPGPMETGLYSTTTEDGWLDA